MGRVNETMRTVNSAVRTLLMIVFLAGAGFLGWKGYSVYNQPQEKLAAKERELEQVRLELNSSQEQIENLTADLQAKQEEVDRLETSMRLLKLNHRIAHIRVLEQTEADDSNRVTTTIEFFEVNDDSSPIGESRTFEIEGDRVYVECLVAKFEDKFVERSDIDRATAICLFQRIFGEYQEPQEGFVLDQVGTRPTSYERGGKISEFEQQIWDDFWNIANDREKAAEMGIRAAHADAPSIRVEPGKTYQIELRATGEFTIRPIHE